KTLRTRALASDHERNGARHHEGAAGNERVRHHGWPIDDIGRLLLNPVLPNVLNYADHFLPRRVRIPAEPFPDRGRATTPKLPRPGPGTPQKPPRRGPRKPPPRVGDQNPPPT